MKEYIIIVIDKDKKGIHYFEADNEEKAVDKVLKTGIDINNLEEIVVAEYNKLGIYDKRIVLKYLEKSENRECLEQLQDDRIKENRKNIRQIELSLYGK